MKKWLTGLLTLGVLFSLAACKTSETKEAPASQMPKNKEKVKQ